MHTSFAGKRVVFGVTGSIAAFKAAGWVSQMVKDEAIVDVVLTSAAARFVTPLTFSAISGRKTYSDLFSSSEDEVMAHIDLGKNSDCIVIAPASAQTIAKLAGGLADNLLTTTVLAARVPVIVCPAMNVQMYENGITQKNIAALKEQGVTIVEPDSGKLACGDEGAGRLPEWDEAKEFILREIAVKDLTGQKVLVTAGPTRETYDAVRFISNRSSGKMGYAIAQAAFRRGADVTLISGPTSLPRPAGVTCIDVTSAEEMYNAVMQRYSNASVIIKAAAVSDFRSGEIHRGKIKKKGAPLVMNLVQNRDILKELGQKRDPEKQLLVGFAAESSDIEGEGKRKLQEKNLDLIAVNDISSVQTGFAGDYNQLILIDRKNIKRLAHTTKIKTADFLLDYIVEEGFLRK